MTTQGRASGTKAGTTADRIVAVATETTSRLVRCTTDLVPRVTGIDDRL